MGSFEAPLSEVWIVCHGYGQLAARFLSRFAAVERADRLFVAPEALSRYYLSPPQDRPHTTDSPIGATWMTAQDRESEIADYVRYLDLLHEEIFSVIRRESVQLWVLGFSQGVATVARWVARGGVSPDRVVLWSGFLPQEMDARSAAALSRGAPLTVVMGTRDEFATPEVVAEQEARLATFGVRHQTVRFDGGHDIHAETLRSIAEGKPA